MGEDEWVRHVAPHTRLPLEFPLETGLILRCAGKVEKAFQTKQVNRPSCRDQEGRRGSDEVVLGTSGFPSSAQARGGSPAVTRGCRKQVGGRSELTEFRSRRRGLSRSVLQFPRL